LENFSLFSNFWISARCWG